MKYSSLTNTCNRFELLTKRSLPTIIDQTIVPTEIVIVNDGEKFSEDQIAALHNIANNVALKVIHTQGNQGAAIAWNTGLEYLYYRCDDFYIAILDDDDEWDTNHAEANLQAAQTNDADIVISGLRMYDELKGSYNQRVLINHVDYKTFLVRNPGWQGSNTFVKKSALEKINGFTPGLKSCNDRDLAIRLLLLPQIKLAYTNQFTATWHFYYIGNRLTSIDNNAKHDGLLQFWDLHNNKMSDEEKTSFFNHCERVFKVNREEFTNGNG